MTKTYEQLVSSARERARDLLRMEMINGCRDVIMRYNNELKAYNKDVEATNKALAVLDYKATKLDPADPEVEQKKKDLEESRKYCVKDLEDLNKAIAAVNAKIDAENKAIAEITDGKTLVSADEMSAVADNLLKEMVTAAAVDEAKV